MASGVRKVVSSTISRLIPSTPISKLIVISVNTSQGSLKPNCMPPLLLSNKERTHSEIPKVTSEVTSAVQRMAVFWRSPLRKAITSTPSSGKSVTNTRGCKR